jgi:alkylated DNA repair dioxygenase AlkB
MPQFGLILWSILSVGAATGRLTCEARSVAEVSCDESRFRLGAFHWQKEQWSYSSTRLNRGHLKLLPLSSLGPTLFSQSRSEKGSTRQDSLLPAKFTRTKKRKQRPAPELETLIPPGSPAGLPLSHYILKLQLLSSTSSSPRELCEQVGQFVTPQLDPSGRLASLFLVRLLRHCLQGSERQTIAPAQQPLYQDQNVHGSIARHDNHCQPPLISDGDQKIVTSVTQSLISAAMKFVLAGSNDVKIEPDANGWDLIMDGMKASSVLCRLLASPRMLLERPGEFAWGVGNEAAAWSCMWRTFWGNPQIVSRIVSGSESEKESERGAMNEHHWTGLRWALDTLDFADRAALEFDERFLKDTEWPHPLLKTGYDKLQIPFRVIPGVLCDVDNLSVAALQDEVAFTDDTIVTTSTSQQVRERRSTAWQGDPSVAPFAYSGKSMPRNDWSPVVKSVRDIIHQQTGQYYDGCLLNLYPDGDSAMRYHIDPDQGTLWDYDTTVVSVGATRRFAFRRIPATRASATATAKTESYQSMRSALVNFQPKPHSFLLLHGDITCMFGDCQHRYQHTVKKSDDEQTQARSSMVFKRALAGGSAMQ